MPISQLARAACAALLVAFTTAEPAEAQWSASEKLTSENLRPPANFGAAAAARDALAAVGAPIDGETATQAGAVFVFRREQKAWLEQAKLIGSGGAARDKLGFSVATDGVAVIAGAPFANPSGGDSGAAYIFAHDDAGWFEQTRLTAGDGRALDRFGYSVALWGGWALVGAPYDDDLGADSGSVFVFHEDEGAWSQVAKLHAPAAASGHEFGFAVAMEGDAAWIGAPGDAGAGGDSGVVHVFRLLAGEWQFHATLASADGSAGDRFGAAVTVRGDFALVGAPRDDSPAGVNHGAAYVFRRDGQDWTQEARLQASDAAPSDFFGFALSIGADAAAVGAALDDDAGLSSGAAYMFRRAADASWSQEAKLVPDDAATRDLFGSAVALDADTVLVGSPGADAGAADAGAVYVFTVAPPNRRPTCDAGGEYLVECSPTGETRVALSAAGSSDPDEDALRFRWTTACAGVEIDDPNASEPTLSLRGVQCGEHCAVTLSVTDGVHEPVSCEATVTLTDKTAPALSCPAEVKAVAGQSIDPDSLGTPQVEDCDPAVSLSYSDVDAPASCASDPLATTIERTWTATDACGNESTCTQVIQVLKLSLGLDIKPEDCPSPHNPGSKGVLKIAILGADGVSAEAIALDSVRMQRADCKGESVAPQSERRGPKAEWSDRGAPAKTPCECRDSDPDGLIDVTLAFDSEALDDGLALSDLPRDALVELVVTGVIDDPQSPFDGAAFVARDCVRLVGGGPDEHGHDDEEDDRVHGPDGRGADDRHDDSGEGAHDDGVLAVVDELAPAGCGPGAATVVSVTLAGFAAGRTGRPRRRGRRLHSGHVLKRT